MVIQELNCAGWTISFQGSDFAEVVGHGTFDRRGLRLKALTVGDFALLFVAEKCMCTFLVECEHWEAMVGDAVSWLAGVQRLHELVTSFKRVEAEGGFDGVGLWAETVYKDFWRGIIEQVDSECRREIRQALDSVAGKREVTEIGGDAAGDRA